MVSEKIATAITQFVGLQAQLKHQQDEKIQVPRTKTIGQCEIRLEDTFPQNRKVFDAAAASAQVSTTIFQWKFLLTFEKYLMQ